MLKKYFDDLNGDVNRQSERIREFFSTHRLSAGENREDIVAGLLKDHLLPMAGIGTGLVLSCDGEFSNQSDVVLFDPLSNAPLFPRSPIPIWLLEATYGVIEVKTQLNPTELADAVSKCRRFKTLSKHFADGIGRRHIDEHLFVLWAFEAPSNETAKANIQSALTGVPDVEQPDFIVVPGRFIMQGGTYRRLAYYGKRGSLHYNQQVMRFGGDETKLPPPPFEMSDLSSNTLTAFLIWINSWIYAAGPRRPDLVRYYPDEWGKPI